MPIIFCFTERSVNCSFDDDDDYICGYHRLSKAWKRTKGSTLNPNTGPKFDADKRNLLGIVIIQIHVLSS